ncbi:MAG: NADP-dependent oxidoreductase [Acidimicrobiales bacterium]
MADPDLTTDPHATTDPGPGPTADPGLADDPEPPVNRRVLLVDRGHGPITEDLFRIDETAVPEPGPGDVVVRNVYLSCDPYLVGRIHTGFPLDEPVTVRVVGVVAASANPAWPVGTVVWGFLGWELYSLAPGAAGLERVDVDAGPISYAISVLGMPGLTAYVGLVDIGRPVPGDTVYVSSAAGAVGSIAGQLARLAGARVVGSAGSAAKCRHVEDELGFDACFDRRVVEVGAGLDRHCPDGIDVYFDNVGGATLDAVLARLRPHARIPVCGQISTYTRPGPGLTNIIAMLRQRATMTGFSIYDHTHRLPEFRDRMRTWLADGDVVYHQDIQVGIDRVPAAFVGMLNGSGIGKRLVRVGPDPHRTGDRTPPRP